MKSVKKIALGGIIAALSLCIMLLTGIFPMAEYTLPMIAGVLLVVLVIEMGVKSSLLIFLAVSILSVILVPLKDSAVFYVVFLGWYPIIKSKLESIKNRVIEWILKFSLFNISIISGVFISLYLFKITEYFEIFSNSFWLTGILFVFINVVFVIYDIAVTRMVTIYIRWFKPKYMNKIFKSGL